MAAPIIAALRQRDDLKESVLHTAQELVHRASIYGVARVSYGSGFMKAAISNTRRLAQEIIEKGTCSLLKEGMQTPEIVALVTGKK